jgi:hypothetical protein
MTAYPDEIHDQMAAVAKITLIFFIIISQSSSAPDLLASGKDWQQ